MRKILVSAAASSVPVILSEAKDLANAGKAARTLAMRCRRHAGGE